VNRVSLIQAVNHFLRLAVRGLVRVALETDVRIAGHDGDVWARARNVSRGGIFVESERDLPPDSEVQLEFALPETPDALAPTAKVVWRRMATRTLAAGLGLQFLKLDRDARGASTSTSTSAPPSRTSPPSRTRRSRCAEASPTAGRARSERSRAKFRARTRLRECHREPQAPLGRRLTPPIQRVLVLDALDRVEVVLRALDHRDRAIALPSPRSRGACGNRRRAW